MKIFNITHKPIPHLNNELYTAFQVNSNVNPIIFDGILQDNTLDNIASKNDNYCELTACYWLWKNENALDYIGLCHYRRYFNFFPNKFSLRPSTQKRISSKKLHNHKIATTPIELQRRKIIADLKTVDFILPKPRKMKVSISEDYCEHHRESDLNKVKEIILLKYPEYKADISKYLDKNYHFYQCNMMITSKQNWDNYHAWLFDILFELEKHITLPEDNFQRRIFGFMSERLFNLYIHHNTFKIKEYPLLFITD
jgi:hypothetical protein